VELIPEPGLDISEKTLPVLAAMAADLRIPCVMTADAHFPRAEDHEVEDLLLSVGIGMKVNDKRRTLKLPGYQYYCSEDELALRAYDCGMPPKVWKQHVDQAIANTAIIGERCNVEIPKASPIAFPGVGPEGAADLLWRWVQEGVVKRRQQGLLKPELEGEYYDRAVTEYTLLKGKGFCDYLLAVTDLIIWCKSQGGLVMCRGSAGGCLLLWLLGASETDSIRHGLSFERFFDETRTDPPDVDVDFEQSWRGRVIDYVFERYGSDNCSQIAALSLQRAKSALHDAANAYGIPDSEIMPLAVLLDSKDDDFDGQISGPVPAEHGARVWCAHIVSADGQDGRHDSQPVRRAPDFVV
jgi:DNA polymerase-3 subunit alpha